MHCNVQWVWGILGFLSVADKQQTKSYRWIGHRVLPPHMCFFIGCFLLIYFYFALSLVICKNPDVFLNGGNYLWSLKWLRPFPREENECHPPKILPRRGAHTAFSYYMPQNRQRILKQREMNSNHSKSCWRALQNSPKNKLKSDWLESWPGISWNHRRQANIWTTCSLIPCTRCYSRQSLQFRDPTWNSRQCTHYCMAVM